MRWLLLSLTSAFLGLGSGPLFATSEPACEHRLVTSFSSLIEKAFSQGVITREQLSALAQAEHPYNPLETETPGSKNSAFMRAINTHLQMDGTAWSKERGKLQKLAGILNSNSEISAEASRVTAPIFKPRFLESIPSKRSAWIEHNGRAYLAVVVQDHLQLREIGNPKPLWIDREPFTPSGDLWFKRSNGHCALVRYVWAKKTGLERLTQLRRFRYDGVVIDVDSLAQTEHTIYVKEGELVSTVSPLAPDFVLPKLHAKIEENRYNSTRVIITGAGQGDQVFATKCRHKAAYPRVLRRTDGEILLAIFCDETNVHVYSPFKSKEPEFQYRFDRRPGGLAPMATQLQIFEKNAIVYLAAEITHGPMQIFDIRSNTPISELDWKGIDGDDLSLLNGANDQLYWVTKSWSSDLTSIVSLFSPP